MKILSIITLLIYSVNCFAIQYKFRLIDVVDGLSDNQIRGLSMTPDERIAIRTASILNIYNGGNFEYFHYDKKRKYTWSYSNPTKEYYDSQGRIWMKEEGYLLLLDLNTNQFIYNLTEELTSFGITNPLKNLFIDDSKNYWFVTEDNTVSFYDTEKQKQVIIEDGNSDFTKKHGIPIELSQYKNHCWIVYSSGLIRCWDYASGEFILQETYFLNIINSFTRRINIQPDSNGNIWLMYNNGVYFYNRFEKEWKEIASIRGASNFFTCMDIDNGGNIWVGTSKSGLRFINHETHEVTTIQGMKLINGGILDNDIYTIFIDKNDGLWIGTLFQGLCYYHPSMQKFQLIQTKDTETYITNETIRCFLEEDNGTILVGSGLGLYRFFPENKKIERIFKDEINDLCLSLYKDRDNRIWVGTYLNGFFCIEGNSIKKYIRSTVNLEMDPSQNISRALYEDSQGRFWVSITGGVGQFDPTTGRIISMLSDKHPKIKEYKLIYSFYCIDENTFASVGDNGIYYYNTKLDSLWLPEIDEPDCPKFEDYGVKYFGLLKDRRGLEWFGIEDGIRIWDQTSHKLYKITTKEGLPNDVVTSLLEDNSGAIWVSTLNGICKVVPQSTLAGYQFSIVSFGTSDGLQSGKFYEHAMLKAKNGSLYFGGAHGFNYFDPQKIIYNRSNNTPLFTGFRLFNTLIKENDEYKGRIILKKPINRTDKIVLSHTENFVTLEFSGMNYVNPSQTYYKYKLKNFDESWNEILCNGLGRATYTGLPPGKYNFIVYTANNDKIWGDKPSEMTIIIKPPFWATLYAILIYIILFLGILSYLLRAYKRKSQKKTAKEREIYEQNQKEKLDQMKFRFFTNISHEFRTPLTLILTPLEMLIKQQSDEILKKKLESIYQNAYSLLNLVNQLLDFRKLEIKGERTVFKSGNIIQFIENIFVQFKDLAINKGIDYVFDTECDYLIMNYDHDKMHKLMNNLLSNAFKFITQGGHISINIKKVYANGRGYVLIQVCDDGCGIEEKKIDHIFDRFYQADEDNCQQGSGIGLHLVKEYVKLHEGEIGVNSQIDKGSTFTIHIPLDLPLTNGDKTHDEVQDKLSNPFCNPEKNTRKKLLLVEDNEDFRHFLKDQLSENYLVIEAPDGEKAKDSAITENPDLIISDLMMPNVNGIELCQWIKGNIETSHIPFILLTARASDESKTDGYEAGADSYISKPFSFEMLCVRIRKLIEQQERRKEFFKKTIEITPGSITTTSLDEELVRKVLIFVEKNMDDPNYSVDDLSNDVGLSKTHLNRKLQSIIALTPLQFIRSVRLKRAAQLLVKSQYNINEIAYMVGFNTLKYFNKHFKDEFKMTPTQYRENNKDQEINE